MTDTTTADTVTETTETTTVATDTAAPDVDALQAELDKWKAQARKHEDRAKANAAAQKELDELRKASMTDLEKAVETAKAEGYNEGRAAGLGQLVAAKIEAAAAGRLAPEALVALIGGLNLSSFVDEDGEVDQDKVASFVDSVAPAAKDPFVGLDLGQGARQRDSDPMALNGDPLLKAVTDRLKH
jgi:multidrug efflux pump subunit AcrA (membrane-fusion protein)